MSVEDLRAARRPTLFAVCRINGSGWQGAWRTCRARYRAHGGYGGLRRCGPAIGLGNRGFGTAGKRQQSCRYDHRKSFDLQSRNVLSWDFGSAAGQDGGLKHRGPAPLQERPFVLLVWPDAWRDSWAVTGMGHFYFALTKLCLIMIVM